MFIVTYDISSNRVRAQFNRFLRKYGRKLQYSVYEIKNSPRVLDIIQTSIENNFKKKFEMSDSVLIFPITEKDQKKTIRYGYSIQEEEEVLILG